MKHLRSRTKRRRLKNKTRRALKRLRGGSNHEIQRRIFCFWTGTNEMSENRKKCMDDLIAKSGCTVVLVKPDNLSSYILKDHPLHPAYEYLSETHKSDFLRTYFMHLHGGGYSDIKKPTGDWNKAFDDIIGNKEIIINGYHEPSIGGVAGDEETKSHWKEIPGNCAYIIRPRTEFTEKWYSTLISLLDSKLEALKQNPSKHPRAGFTPDISPGYPIKWAEMLGDIFHPLTCKYRHKILFTVPIPDFSSEYL